jgi:hypothetical protein
MPIQPAWQMRFAMPDRIVTDASSKLNTSTDQREQVVGD